jgi:uncharacterized protein YcnI
MNRRLPISLALAAAVAALAAGSAFAHAHVLPEVALTGDQLYSVVVPNEKDDATTTKVVLNVPEGFGIDLFDETPGWKREITRSGSGEDARVTRVTWTSDGEGTDEGALFHFPGGSDDGGSYTFPVEQTYSDGSVVDWSGPEDADDPAPVVELEGSLGGGGSSTLAIVALVVGAIGLLLGGVALATGRGRQLA